MNDNVVVRAAPWWVGERVMFLGTVPALLPRRAGGGQVSAETIYRWSRAGVGGVRLRRFRAAGRGWATTEEEVVRFQHAITELAGGDA
ncbi:MAG: hypothetical protein IPM13_18265 [Phycisphaerales bacterium]|nr:hypothetical protein [Phycisphaerales bacterium]